MQARVSTAHSTQMWVGIDGLPWTSPTALTTVMATAPRTRALSALMTMYTAGLSGVSRSCRDQPSARSVATIAPPAAAVSAAPYSAIETMM